MKATETHDQYIKGEYIDWDTKSDNYSHSVPQNTTTDDFSKFEYWGLDNGNLPFALAFLSFVCLTDYIWRQKCKPYDLERNTFVLPGYRALHTSVEQILNRRVLDENEKSDNSDDSDNFSYIFLCTTLWHETPNELKTLVTSLLELILHKRKNYEFEINICFDNTFEDKEIDGTRIKGKTVLNEYVEDFLTVLQTALALHPRLKNVFNNAQVYSTPYGGRLIYTIEDVELIVHLKDVSKVQPGKRWSQDAVF